MIAPEFHLPNALDLLFFAFDRAGARLSLPGAFIHMNLDLAGQVDVAGLKKALACVHRLYPAAAGRLESSAVTGRPRWRLNGPPPDLDRVVRVRHLTPQTEDSLWREIDGILGNSIDLVSLPPLQFHVLRGLPSGDYVVVRWPHAFMDARGGFVIMDAIDRLYREAAEPTTVASAGDESLNGMGPLLRPDNRTGKNVASPSRRQTRTVELQLPTCPAFRELGPLRSRVRTLNEDQCRLAQDIAARQCAPARFGAYLRACAIQALNRLIPPPKPSGFSYSIPYIIEGRDPPYQSPVCHNIFSLDRLRVPAEIAADRPAVSRFLHEGTAGLVAGGPLTAHLKRTLDICRLPQAVLGAMVRHSLISPPPPWQEGEFAVPPSLPMGFMQAFGHKKRSFCGADIRHVHAFRPPLPRAGIGLQVMAEQGRLAVCGLCYETRWDMMNRLMDEFVENLIRPE